MKLATREVDGRLLVDVTWPLPSGLEQIESAAQNLRDALAGRDDFILVFHDVDFITSKHIGALLGVLKRAEAFDKTPVPIVCADERFQEILRVLSMPLIVAYTTEEEALSPRKKAGGCFGVIAISIVAVIALVVAA